MTKALFKKQMMEVFSWLYQNRRSGKNRSKAGIIGYGLLYLLIFVFLGAMFFFVANMLCAPLASVGLEWLYFALMGLMAVFLGVFGSVFNTYSSLYMAKDNDLLLSMPVPPSRILLIRLFGVFAVGLLYELIVMVPTILVYFMELPVHVLGAFFTLLIPVILAVLVLTLSAVLGWVVALISSRLKNKNVIVVILSLVFLAAYYYFYSQAYSNLQNILNNARSVGDSIRSVLFPFYHMGLAAGGSVLSMLIFTAIIAALFGVTYFVLSRSFLKLATSNRGAARVKYKEHRAEAHPMGRALLSKELRRFLGSSTYMLNCGLGLVFMVAAAVALVIKGDTVLEMMDLMFGGSKAMTSLLAAAAICMIASMNDIAAPSVSLEGKNLWLLQSLPVAGRQVLMAKLKLHLTLTLFPAVVLLAAVEIVLKPALAFAILIPVSVFAFILFIAAFGLFIGVKAPNLTWTSEVVPIKQSLSVTVALFGGWAAVAVLAGGWFFLRHVLDAAVYLLLAAVLLLVLGLLLIGWLRHRGGEIFETL